MVAAEQTGPGANVGFRFRRRWARWRCWATKPGRILAADGPDGACSLDRQIQRTLELLNKAPGKNNYNLIFAAAHGAPPEPDPAVRSQKAIAGESLARAIDKALSDWIDKGAVKNTLRGQVRLSVPLSEAGNTPEAKHARARRAQAGGRGGPASARRGRLLHGGWRLLAHRRVAAAVRKQFQRIAFRRCDALLRAGRRGRFWRRPRRIVWLALQLRYERAAVSVRSTVRQAS